jgi:hypothetical protein
VCYDVPLISSLRILVVASLLKEKIGQPKIVTHLQVLIQKIHRMTRGMIGRIKVV